MINVLIADPFDLSRSGLVSLVSNQPDMRIVCQTDSSDRLLSDIHEHEPDVVVMDFRFDPDAMVNSISSCNNSNCRFLLLANETPEPSTIIRSLLAGAHGCIHSSMGDEFLIQSIRDVASNCSPISPIIATQLLKYIRNINNPLVEEGTKHPQLSRREYLVLNLLNEGMSNKIIGNQLKISERTVEAHVRNIFRKMNATSRTHAVFLASKKGWLQNNN